MHECCFSGICLFVWSFFNVCVVTWFFVASSYCEVNSQEEVDSLTLVCICVRWCGGFCMYGLGSTVGSVLMAVLCAGGLMERDGWSQNQALNSVSVRFSIMWWQEPHQLGQLRRALSSCPNLAFVQMHVQYLVFGSQNKITDILQGCLQGVQTWVLFESSQNLGILFSWHLFDSRSIKYTKNCFEQSEPRQGQNMRLQDDRVGEIL